MLVDPGWGTTPSVPPPPAPAPPGTFPVVTLPPPPPLPPRPAPAPPPAPTAPDVRGYSGGWCTAYVATRAPWIPAGLGDALTWPERAAAKGFTLTMIPTVGSVVCYGPGGGYSSLGHVAFVVNVYGLDSFEVAEMAYAAWNRVDLRDSNMQDVVGFILPPGVAPGAGVPVAPPPPPQGLDGAFSTWSKLGDFLTRGVSQAITDLGQINGRLA